MQIPWDSVDCLLKLQKRQWLQIIQRACQNLVGGWERKTSLCTGRLDDLFKVTFIRVRFLQPPKTFLVIPADHRFSQHLTEIIKLQLSLSNVILFALAYANCFLLEVQQNLLGPCEEGKRYKIEEKQLEKQMQVLHRLPLLVSMQHIIFMHKLLNPGLQPSTQAHCNVCGDRLSVKAERVLTQADTFKLNKLCHLFLHNQNVYKYYLLICYDPFFFTKAYINQVNFVCYENLGL